MPLGTNRPGKGSSPPLPPLAAAGALLLLLLTAGCFKVQPPAQPGKDARPAGGGAQAGKDNPKPPGQGVMAITPQQAGAFDQLRRGMSEQQVTALLGPPTTRTYHPPKEPKGAPRIPSTTSLVYGQVFGDADFITVDLRDEKVSQGMFRQGGKLRFLQQ